jgi:hypothetical protein
MPASFFLTTFLFGAARAEFISLRSFEFVNSAHPYFAKDRVRAVFKELTGDVVDFKFLRNGKEVAFFETNERNAYSMVVNASGYYEALFISIALSVSGASTILLDEPGRSFHPYWMQRLHHMIFVSPIYADKTIIVATHSPHFISEYSIPFIARCVKRDGLSTVIPLIEANAQPSRLERYAKLFVEPMIAPLFFSSKALIVEGGHDFRLFRGLQQLLYRSNRPASVSHLTDLDCDVIHGGGWHAVLRWLALAKRLQIAAVGVVDFDAVAPNWKIVRNKYAGENPQDRHPDAIRLHDAQSEYKKAQNKHNEESKKLRALGALDSHLKKRVDELRVDEEKKRTTRDLLLNSVSIPGIDPSDPDKLFKTVADLAAVKPQRFYSDGLTPAEEHHIWETCVRPITRDQKRLDPKGDNSRGGKAKPAHRNAQPKSGNDARDDDVDTGSDMRRFLPELWRPDDSNPHHKILTQYMNYSDTNPAHPTFAELIGALKSVGVYVWPPEYCDLEGVVGQGVKECTGKHFWENREKSLSAAKSFSELASTAAALLVEGFEFMKLIRFIENKPYCFFRVRKAPPIRHRYIASLVAAYVAPNPMAAAGIVHAAGWNSAPSALSVAVLSTPGSQASSAPRTAPSVPAHRASGPPPEECKHGERCNHLKNGTCKFAHSPEAIAARRKYEREMTRIRDAELKKEK